MRKREISFALPLKTSIDPLNVQVAPEYPPTELDLKDFFKTYKKYPDEEFFEKNKR